MYKNRNQEPEEKKLDNAYSILFELKRLEDYKNDSFMASIRSKINNTQTFDASYYGPATSKMNAGTGK
jgi:hypothetical protein